MGKDTTYQDKQLHDETMSMGEGGDSRQIDIAAPNLTTQIGTPIADDQNSLRLSKNGPVLMEDFILREKLFHFDHERIPERVVHARGFGVHGFFETYESLSDITRAHLFQKKGEKTPVFVRFSTVLGNKGSPDLVRDVRGFAVKFYTQEGNWDLVGNNIPVFFIQDAIKFPDIIHAGKDEPDRGFPQAQTAHDNFWDFVSLTPESMHMLVWIMSDRTIPRSFRFMEGFGVHTFRFVNENNQSTFVKFHWKPSLGLQSVTWDEAVKINGVDPDYHRRDLWENIQKGNFPEWELGVQLFDETFAKKFPFDVLDATKLIPEEMVPIKVIGRMVLNRCVDNFFAETEQVAFCTQNIVPGLDFTDDPLLQGRNFSYLDTQLKRLGSPNFNYLPINAPKCPFAHFQQDGHMAFYNPAGRANYNPNSWHEGPRENPEKGFHSYTESFGSTEKVRARSEKFKDHYSQARQFYRSQTTVEQQHIAKAFIFELSRVETPKIRERMVAHLLNIDEDLATTIATGLGFESLPEPCEVVKKPNKNLPLSPKLSILQNGPNHIKGRQIGILVGENVDASLFQKLTTAIGKMKAEYKIIAPRIQGIFLNSGDELLVDFNLEAGSSVLFDAVVILIPEADARTSSHMKTLEFLNNAYLHCKFIAGTETLQNLMLKMDLSFDKGCFDLNLKNGVSTFLGACGELRFWQRVAINML